MEQKLNFVADKSYTKKNVLDVFSAIVNSGCGYVPYQTLADLVGSEEVNKMIEHNILHYRPESNFYTDLHPSPKSAVVTATGPHALRAMEALLRRCPSPLEKVLLDKPEQADWSGDADPPGPPDSGDTKLFVPPRDVPPDRE